MESNPLLEPDGDAQRRWLQEVKLLLAELAGSDIVELEYVRGDARLHLVREATDAPPRAMAIPVAEAPVAEAAESIGAVITTPITGVFYITPSPGAPPFVTVGSRVEVGQVVGLVEAMKVFNEITSDVAGTVVQILVEPGAVVEKGQPLLIVREE